ncbi:MAG TPA: hypothetical protein VLM38_16780 [Blastocatellia bacterium]|nr:hypothetical protein [Blastocatellia bacterium]
MNTRVSAALLIGLAIIFGFIRGGHASRDEESPTQQTNAQQDKDKSAPEKKAALLLDQVLGEAGSLKLPENRIYVQISAADLLWDRDETRARALMIEAAGGVADLLRRNEPNDRRPNNVNRIALDLRQTVVMSAARHDTTLAYQLLQTMPAPPTTGPGGRGPGGQGNLEQSLVAIIAANDPKAAIKTAQEWLDKGEYPASMTRVLAQLQTKDADSTKKLTDSLVKRLQPEDMLAKQDAARLTLNLLRAGPRPDKKQGDGAQPAASNSGQILNESAYRDVMAAAITAALRATPQPAGGGGRGQGGFRGRPNNPAGQAPNAPQTDADVAQSNARALLSGLQTVLAQVDAYLPERSLAVRQKLTQLGMGDDQRSAFGQMANLMQQGTSESLTAAAANAPPGMQNRLYQQAAMKALDEGNPDRAREIANHLDGTARDNLLRTVDLRVATRSASANKMDQIRQTIASAKSDDERLSLLLQFASTLENESPKLAIQLLDEARGLVAHRATSYAELEAQLRIPHAFAALDPAKSFDALDPVIAQINELLSAASTLNGFEVNVFRDGELPLQGSGLLAWMVMRCGAELATLAKVDFDRAQMMTERFQLAEPRILAKLTMVREMLGVKPLDGNSDFSGVRGLPGQFGGRRPQ